MIIKSERKKDKKTARIKLPDALQMMNISYGRIIDDKTNIIVMKSTMKSIGVDKNP